MISIKNLLNSSIESNFPFLRFIITKINTFKFTLLNFNIRIIEYQVLKKNKNSSDINILNVNRLKIIYNNTKKLALSRNYNVALRKELMINIIFILLLYYRLVKSFELIILITIFYLLFFSINVIF